MCQLRGSNAASKLKIDCFRITAIALIKTSFIENIFI